MATKKLNQSQLELQAGSSGESARQRSHESLMNSRNRALDRAERARQFDESVEQRNLDRWQRQWEQRREERARRDAERQQNQAQKPRSTNFGNEGYLEGQERRPSGDPRLDEQARQFDERQAQQERQFQQSQAQQQQQFDTRTDLTAATHGLQREGGAVAGGNPGPDNPRLQALQAEMNRRGEQQMGQGLESTGRRFVPTPEAERAATQRADLAEREMAVKEKNARANFMRAKTAYERLDAQEAAAKTAAQRKEAQAAKKAQRENMMQYIKSAANRLDRFMKGEQTQADMQSLRYEVGKTPPVGAARGTYDEVQAGEIGPRVTSFLSEQVAARAIEYIYATGMIPEGDLVDFSSAGMQEFVQRAREARQMLMPHTVAGQMLTDEQINQVKRGYAGHVEMVNKMAALFILKKQPVAPGAALGAEPAQTHEFRRADPTSPPTPAERSGQITPEEAGRRAEEAGGRAAPSTQKKPYSPRPAPSYGVRGGLSGNLPYGV